MSRKKPHTYDAEHICTKCGTETKLDHGIQMYRETDLDPWTKVRPTCLGGAALEELILEPLHVAAERRAREQGGPIGIAPSDPPR